MTTTDTAPLSDRLRDAMQDAWNDFCSDTGHHPDCFSRKGASLYADFSVGNFAEMVATRLECALAERDRLRKEAEYLRTYARTCVTERNAAYSEVSSLQGSLSASQAREAGMREALEPFLVAAAGMAEIDMPDDAAVLRASADWWLRSGEAGKKGRPLTFGDFRKLAALLSQPASDALPRKLALSLYETWTFVLMWAVGQAHDHGGKMHRLHAAILARLHDAMTSAATAGLLLGDSTARLPGLLAEHGFDLEDLLRETAPVETKEPSHG
ncbi:hypothetical protein TSH58p_17360 [Azospirillum sp. TSH58]|uniref:hypothetical protein n=1 Tax=Azospirillum sp. TSH58 TaxID=664962 RepID=UPI000D600E5A|nr:hypothetical protein [Azospirillum sp. TSH58]AWJ85133.1 hypothetical protein TSH58p_17360 [Azospirillum sp. TSH58]PWC80810.1 hypothetical protein TSH58_00765 [Azospirillum sp. TSH58]